MRKMLLGLGAIAGTGMIAVPAAAAAKAGPRVAVSVGIGQPYHYGAYGYDRRGYDRGQRYDARRHFAYNKVRELQNRVGQMRQDIRYFGRQGALDRREYAQLDQRADRLQQRIARMAHRGLNQREYRKAVNGIRKLRQEIRRDLRDGNRYANYGYGYRGDRDRYWGDDDRWSNDNRWRDADRYYDRRDRARDDDWDD